jgi:diacylglycerol kinase family enzyme
MMARPVTGNRVLIFANPIAGKGLGEAIAYRVREALAAAGFDARMWLLPPSELDRGDLPKDVRAVVVIGGDGTVRSVAERLYILATGESIAIDPADRPATPAGMDVPPLLIIPLGTANLMGRHLGIDWDDDHLDQQVVDAVRNGRVVQVDAARANGQLFLLMVGVGFDAAVVHELSRVRRGPISYFSYVEPAARIATSYTFPALRVRVDGRWVFGPERGVVFVGNVPEYGTGFPMLPLARPDDNLLDVCCMPCANLPEAIRMFLLAAAGEHLQEEGVYYGKAREVRIEGLSAADTVPVQIDGDAAGHTPIQVDLLPRRLGLIVP